MKTAKITIKDFENNGAEILHMTTGNENEIRDWMEVIGQMVNEAFNLLITDISVTHNA